MDAKQLAALPLFADLDKRERRRVAERADEVDVPAGKELASQGDLAYEFFVIEDGTARVEHAGADDEHTRLGPGDFFGEIGLLEHDHRRTATVTAETPMRLMVLTGADFRVLNRELPDVGQKVGSAMRERLSTTGA
jgi:voltage-gated potassium channel